MPLPQETDSKTSSLTRQDNNLLSLQKVLSVQLVLVISLEVISHPGDLG